MSTEKVFNALVFQDNYEEKLTKSVQEVKDLTIKIRDDAILCSQERQRKMDDKLKDVSVEQKVQSQVLQSLWGEQRLQRQVLENLHRHLLSHPGLSPSTREPLDGKIS